MNKFETALEIVANDKKDAIMGIETGEWKPFYPRKK